MSVTKTNLVIGELVPIQRYEVALDDIIKMDNTAIVRITPIIAPTLYEGRWETL